jgi:predicted CxxxxCH...CXXCH cytochrome family protein
MRAVDAVGLAVELGQLLEKAKLPYAIGGALALGVHGVSLHAGLARVVQCPECQMVPSAVVQGQHLDGVAQITFTEVARANLAQPTKTCGNEPTYQAGTCASAACHDIANYTVAPGGGTVTTPRWTMVDGSQATCTSCHGMPPPLPHVQRSACESCHLNVDCSAHVRESRAARGGQRAVLNWSALQ